MMTQQDKDWHAVYEMLPDTTRGVVDEAYKAAREVILDAGFVVSNVDPAESLVAAIYRYIQESST